MSNQFDFVSFDRPFSGPKMAVTMAEGHTISDIIRHAEIDPEMYLHLDVKITLGGRTSIVPMSAWHIVRPRRGTHVSIAPVMHGMALAPLLQVILGAAAPALAGALGYVSGTFMFALVTAGISIVGSLLIRALVPPPSQSTSQNDDPVFNLTGASNNARPYDIYPTVLGRHIMFPVKTATGFTETVEDAVYLRERMTFGYGPVALSDLKIGTTPITEFSDVEIEFLNVDQSLTEAAIPDLLTSDNITIVGWRQGTTAMTIYPDDIVEDNYSVVLNADQSVVRQTRTLTKSASVDISFQGLVQMTDGGDKNDRTVNIDISFRAVGDTAWTVHETKVCTDNTTTYVRFTSVIDFPAEGQYDVRVERVTADDNDTKIRDTATLTAIRSIQTGSLPSHANISEIAIRIKASEELNGNIQSLNAIVQQLAPVWDGAQWSALQPVRHPAWIYARSLMGPQLRDPVPDTRIDLNALKAWADSEPHWTCDLVLEGATRLADVLDLVCAAGRARRGLSDLNYSVVRDGGAGAIVQVFTPRNSWDFSGKRFLDREIHAFRVRVISERKNWAQDEIMVYNDGHDASTATEIETLSLPGCVLSDDGDNAGNAWRLARYHMAVATLRSEGFEFNSDLDHIVCQMGDKVRVVHDVPKFGVGVGRISHVPDGDTISEFTLDEALTTDGGTYRLTVRRPDGSLRTLTGNNAVNASTWVLDDNDVFTGDVAIDDLVIVERTEAQSVDLLILGINHMDELRARISAVPAAPEVLTADTGIIPDYDPSITPLIIHGPSKPVVLNVRSNFDTAVIETDLSLSPRIGVQLGTVSNIAASDVSVRVRSRKIGSTRWTYMPLTPWASEVFTGILEVGSQYDVGVAFFDKDGRSQGYVNVGPILVETTGEAIPAPVWTGLPGVDTITLSGPETPSLDRVGYHIYASTDADDTLVLVGYTNVPHFVYMPPPTPVYTRYKVAAVNYGGSDGDLSAYILVEPTGVTLTNLAVDVTSAIDDAAQSALADKLAAEAAASAAQAAENTASTHASNAATAQGIAVTARDQSQAAETASVAAQGLAETAANDALGYKNTAATHANTATTQATNSQNSATSSANSASAAATSANNSGNSASAASSSASQAASSATSAGSSASASEASRQAADTAAGNASVSESAAAVSASNASGSANSAALSATLSVTAQDTSRKVARDMIPSTFDEDGIYWMDGITGHPDNVADIIPSVSHDFHTVSGEGRVLALTTNGSTNVGVSPKAGVRVAGNNTYRTRVRVRLLSGDANPANNRFIVQSRVISEDYVTSSLVSGSEFDFTTLGEWAEIEKVHVLPTNLSGGVWLRPYVYAPPSGNTPGNVFEVAWIEIENITSLEAANAAASASNLSAANAAASELSSGASASTSTTQAGVATTKAGEASTSASNAATSETNAAGSASTAASQATISANAASDAQNAASAAASSASSASASNTAAGQEAASATTSANNAATEASNSLNSANASSVSASQAAASEALAGTHATSSQSSALSAEVSARQTFPSDFAEDGKHFTEDFGTVEGVEAAPGHFVTDATYGRVYQATGFKSLGPRGYRRLIPGRTYFVEYRVRMITDNVSGANSDFTTQMGQYTDLTSGATWSGLSAGPSTFSNATVADGVLTLGGTYTNNSGTYQYIKPRIYHGYNGGGNHSDGTWQVLSVVFTDISSEAASEDHANAAAASATLASAAVTDAGAQAAIATSERLSAETAAGTATNQATAAATSATNAEGFSIASTNSALLSAQYAAMSSSGNMAFNGAAQNGLDNWSLSHGATNLITAPLSDINVPYSNYIQASNLGTPSDLIGNVNLTLPEPVIGDFVGKTIRVSAWVQTSHSSLPVQLGLAMIRADGSFYYPNRYWAVGAADNWTYFSFDFTVATSVESLSQFWGRVYSRDGVNDWMRVTGVTIEDVTDFVDLSASISQESAARVTDIAAVTATTNAQSSDIGALQATTAAQAVTLASVDGYVQATSGVAVTTVDVNGVPRVSAIQQTSFANPDGTGGSLIELDAEHVVANGTVTAGKFTTGAGGTNDLTNTNFLAGTNGWTEVGSGTEFSQTTFSIRAAGNTWAGANYPVGQIFQNGTSNDGYHRVHNNSLNTAGQNSTRNFKVEPGKYYGVSVRASTHRCTGELFLFWRDAAGAIVGTHVSSAIPNNVTASSTNPDAWPIYHVQGQAPSGAAYGQFAIQKDATTSGTDSYLIFHKPHSYISHADAVAPPEYSPEGMTVVDGGSIITNTLNVNDAMVNGSLTVGSDLIVDGAVSTTYAKSKATGNVNVTATTSGTKQILIPEFTTTFAADNAGKNPVLYRVFGRGAALVSEAKLHFLVEGFVTGMWQSIDLGMPYHVSTDGHGTRTHFFEYSLLGDYYDPASLAKLRVACYVDSASPYNGHGFRLDYLTLTAQQVNK